MDDLTVFCVACKKYEWIYPYFFHFADKNLPLPIKFFREEDCGGYVSWNDRMVYALLQITTRDVIYLQEDFLIKYVDPSAVERALEIHRKYKANITKLGNNYEFQTSSFPEEVCGLPVFLQDINDRYYLMSHQPVAIYNRELLLSTFSEKTHNATWHEIEGSNTMRENKTTRVFCIGPSFNPNKSLIFEICHAIRYAELLPEAKQLMEETNL